MRSRFAARAAKKNRRRQLMARAPRVSPTIEAAFVAALRRALKAFHDDIRRAYTPQVRHDDFRTAYATLAQRAKQAADAFKATAFAIAKRLEKFSKAEAVRTLGDIASDLSDTVGGFAEEFAADAVMKLGGLMEESLNDAEQAAYAVTAEEVGSFTLDGVLDAWVSRGINSARNMVTQGTAELNQERQKEAGVEGYYWICLHDGHTRLAHLAMENIGETPYSWDDPPLSAEDSSNGEACHPGDDYECRCLAAPALIPVNENQSEESDEQQESGAA